MGLATANAFAESGAAVVLVDVNEAAVRAAAEQLVAAGHKAIAVPCDVAHDEQGNRLVEQTVSTLCVRIRGVSLSGAKSLGREVRVPSMWAATWWTSSRARDGRFTST